MTGSSTWAVVFGRLLRLPAIVVHDHGTPPEPDRRLRRLQQLFARGSHAIVTVSEADRRRWIETTGADPDCVRVIPNAVTMPPAPRPVDLRAELGLAPGTPLVGCVGLLRAEKAQIVLVEAAARLRETHPELHVVLVGDGPEQAALEAAIAARGLQDRVLLLGLREDVPGLLGSLDVAVCCSDREGIPLSVLEYMETARPIVATRVGGLPELIEDGVHGVLVAPRDPAALAGAIAGLLGDPAAAAALGARARERSEREFDPAAVVRRLEALYDELLAGAQLRS
jgi:glycosyltransferase involved in cell wall biosynthesis